MLEVLGVSPVEERVYDLLLSRGRMSLDEVLAEGKGSPEVRHQALDALLEKGLVRRLSGPEHEYVVAPPEYAIDVLVAERIRELQAVRARSSELAARVRSATQAVDPAELIEVVSGEGSVRQLFFQAIKGARTEIATFDRPPYATSKSESYTQQAERMSLSGLRLRTVFDRSLLDDPAEVQRIVAGLDAGEGCRVANVPLKLAIIDREWAMLPLLHAGGDTPEAVVIVRRSVLLDSLLALFEFVWEHAVEVRAQSDDELALTGTPEAELRQLAHLLATGMTDLAIAHHLGISERTVRRRIKELMDELRVDSRFPAGVRAAARGWV